MARSSLVASSRPSVDNGDLRPGPIDALGACPRIVLIDPMGTADLPLDAGIATLGLGQMPERADSLQGVFRVPEAQGSLRLERTAGPQRLTPDKESAIAILRAGCVRPLPAACLARL